MALEHAILVSLSEQPASGLDLTRRFDRSIGFFWTATHQQIYRVLGRMESDGWVLFETVAQQGRPDKKVYDVTAARADRARRWLAEPDPGQHRSDLAVKLRAASYGDREAVLDACATALRRPRNPARSLRADGEARLPRPDDAGRRRPRPVPRAARRGAHGAVLDHVADEYLDAHESTSHDHATPYPHLLAPLDARRPRCATAW